MKKQLPETAPSLSLPEEEDIVEASEQAARQKSKLCGPGMKIPQSVRLSSIESLDSSTPREESVKEEVEEEDWSKHQESEKFETEDF